MLPGTIVLAVFVSAMISGGIIYIDDKARGLHEGYLVTPISKLELVLGFNFAGALKAIIAGVVLVTAGSVLAGVPDPLNPLRLARLMLVVVASALALISMMSLIMVRINDPLVSRAIFGILNMVLYFPSGAVYPTGAFLGWMKAISAVDPFTYAVHAFKILLLQTRGSVRSGMIWRSCSGLRPWRWGWRRCCSSGRCRFRHKGWDMLLGFFQTAYGVLADWYSYGGGSSDSPPTPEAEAVAIALVCVIIGGVVLSVLNLLGGGLLVFLSPRKWIAFWLVPLVNVVLYLVPVLLRRHPLGTKGQFLGWPAAVLMAELAVIVALSLIWVVLLMLLRWGAEKLLGWRKRQPKGAVAPAEASAGRGASA